MPLKDFDTGLSEKGQALVTIGTQQVVLENAVLHSIPFELGISDLDRSTGFPTWVLVSRTCSPWAFRLAQRHVCSTVQLAAQRAHQKLDELMTNKTMSHSAKMPMRLLDASDFGTVKHNGREKGEWRQWRQ